jgi:hypothetical protein
MAQPVEQQLSDEDDCLITANRLGSLLAVYKLKPACIYILWVCCLFSLISVASVPFLMLVSGGYEIQGDSNAFFLSGIVLCVGLFAGIFILCVELPRVQRYRIIVCERGLLQLRQRRSDALYWRDIHTIRKRYNEYAIRRWGGEEVTLDILYQHVKDLVALIETCKERSAMRVEPGEMYPPLKGHESK